MIVSWVHAKNVYLHRLNIECTLESWRTDSPVATAVAVAVDEAVAVPPAHPISLSARLATSTIARPAQEQGSGRVS